MGFRLARDFLSEEVIFAAIDPCEYTRDQGSRNRDPRLGEQGFTRNWMLHVNQLTDRR